MGTQNYVHFIFEWVNLLLTKFFSTLVLLILDLLFLENIVDPDQLASDEASWSGSAMFSMQPLNPLYKMKSPNWTGLKTEVHMPFQFVQQDKG